MGMPICVYCILRDDIFCHIAYIIFWPSGQVEHSRQKIKPNNPQKSNNSRIVKIHNNNTETAESSSKGTWLVRHHL